MRRYSTPVCSVWRPVTSDQRSDALHARCDVAEVPGVADAAGVALRVDVDGRHQRGQAADRVLERVVDAERGVEDVAVLRDARVLEIVVADGGFVQQARSEGVRVRDAGQPRRRPAERRRRRGVGPAERLFDVLRRPRHRDARLIRRARAGAESTRSPRAPRARSGSPAAGDTPGHRCRCRRSVGRPAAGDGIR